MFQSASVSMIACSIRHTYSRTPTFSRLQVQQRVQHDLAGAVVGHLAAAVDVQHRDVAGHQHVFGLAGLAEGEHRVVLDQPQFVGGGLVARVGEGLHRAPHRLVGLAAQVADLRNRQRRGDGLAGGDGYSVHFTSGWSRSTWWARSYCSRDLGAEG